MITNPLAPVIMAAVFSFAMFCSFFNRKYDTGKYNSPNIPGDTNSSFLGASDGEASKSLLRGRIKLTDKKSWACCIFGMTAVAVTTGLASFGTIPAAAILYAAVGAALVALFSAFYRVVNSVANCVAESMKSNTAGGNEGRRLAYRFSQAMKNLGVITVKPEPEPEPLTSTVVRSMSEGLRSSPKGLVDGVGRRYCSE
jgi:hypothetical protein